MSKARNPWVSCLWSVLLTLLALSMTGCAMNRAKPALGHHVSREVVSSVLVSGDGKQMVVLTSKRHFVFQAPPGLLAALRSRFHPRLTGEFGVLSIDANADATIPVTILMPSGSPEEWPDAQAMGFDTKFGDPTTWQLNAGLMKGVGYKANGVQLPAETLKLNRTYQVVVAETGSGPRYSDLPSPVRWVGEGVLGVALSPLAIVAVPLVLVAMPAGVGQGP